MTRKVNVMAVVVAGVVPAFVAIVIPQVGAEPPLGFSTPASITPTGLDASPDGQSGLVQLMVTNTTPQTARFLFDREVREEERFTPRFAAITTGHGTMHGAAVPTTHV